MAEEKIPEKLLKPYNPTATEGRIYEMWEKGAYFAPQGGGEPFCLLMPPTNANGSLHAGHGLVITIEDLITRYQRMRGRKTLWLPGLDHAGFETQVVYEKKLEKEGRSRFQIPRDQLYREIMDFTLANAEQIKSQIRSLGASCDWSRLRFTLDPEIIKTVYGTFKKLAEDELLYRGARIVNWCPKHQTSFSDLEIKDEEKVDPLYYLKYGPFTIATARPETKFGDKYVVMHPNDARYADYEDGQKIELEWINGPITATVIKDEAIDPEFGSGVMTITPWHDPVDFAIAERHHLDKEQIIDERGKLLPLASEFAGLPIAKARPLIIEKLRAKNLVVKVEENYRHVVRTCYKCGTVIEPQIKSQWFIKMKPLAESARAAIESGAIVYEPEHYRKITLHWLQNIMDWNISRQIVWGIPIPAKICEVCDHGMVDLENRIRTCAKCGGAVRADPDTFDTWFSSGQWPLLALGYPEGPDFKTFYPTEILETAGDIIFFWVARMIMLGLYLTGQVPFKTVYLHGMVLDGQGQKMSKSKGNVINPLDLTAKFGTDAFRLGLIVGNTPGSSLALAEDKIKAYKHFANKIWNVARFVLANCPADTWTPGVQVSELTALVADITADMENYRFYLAGEKLYHYFWHTFADKIIEAAKKDPALKAQLPTILITCLKLLHPFMPFITEEIWSFLPLADKKPLIIQSWPQ